MLRRVVEKAGDSNGSFRDAPGEAQHPAAHRLALWLRQRLREKVRVCQLHRAFGTAEFVIEGVMLDIATARLGRFSAPGATPSVRFGAMADDLVRRDLSINTMALALWALAGGGAGTRGNWRHTAASGNGSADGSAGRSAAAAGTAAAAPSQPEAVAGSDAAHFPAGGEGGAKPIHDPLRAEPGVSGIQWGGGGAGKWSGTVGGNRRGPSRAPLARNRLASQGPCPDLAGDGSGPQLASDLEGLRCEQLDQRCW